MEPTASTEIVGFLEFLTAYPWLYALTIMCATALLYRFGGPVIRLIGRLRGNNAEEALRVAREAEKRAAVVDEKLEGHETLCTERHKTINERFDRLEANDKKILEKLAELKRG